MRTQAEYGREVAGAHCAEREMLLIGMRYAGSLVPLVVYIRMVENGHPVEVTCVIVPVFAESREVLPCWYIDMLSVPQYVESPEHRNIIF